MQKVDLTCSIRDSLKKSEQKILGPIHGSSDKTPPMKRTNIKKRGKNSSEGSRFM